MTRHFLMIGASFLQLVEMCGVISAQPVMTTMPMSLLLLALVPMKPTARFWVIA